MSRVRDWTKKPENVAYLVLVALCLIIAGRKYNVGSILLVLLLMGLLGFVVKQIFFRE
jgi:hypothetical protein